MTQCLDTLKKEKRGKKCSQKFREIKKSNVSAKMPLSSVLYSLLYIIALSFPMFSSSCSNRYSGERRWFIKRIDVIRGQMQQNKLLIRSWVCHRKRCLLQVVSLEDLYFYALPSPMTHD